MSEDEARAWLAARWSSDRIAKLEQFVAILRDEAERQSLIARSTFDLVWSRHIVDSAQLLEHAPAGGPWLDIGSGGGLPGLVIAVLRDEPVTLSEPRRMRVEFLKNAANAIGLSNVSVYAAKVQYVAGRFAAVSARAVAPLNEIFAWTLPVVSRETRYLLQRGRNWQEDVALAKRAWHGVFHVEQSITDSDAGVVIAHGVRPK